MQPEATLFVIDDDVAARQAVAELARAMDLWCESFASAPEFLKCFDPQRPGSVILEVRLPGGVSGLQLQRCLEEQQIDLPLIFLVERIDVASAIEAMRRGALSVVEKPFREMEMWDLVQEAIQLDALRRRQRLARDQIERRVAGLSAAELQLMDNIVAGESNRGIAHREGVCVRTVEIRRAKLMEKLKARSLVDLMEIALTRRGLLSALPDEAAPALAGGNGNGRRHLPPR